MSGDTQPTASPTSPVNIELSQTPQTQTPLGTVRNLEHSWPRSCLCMGFAGFPHSKTCPVSSPLCVPRRRKLRIVASFAGRGVPPAAVPAVAHTSLVGAASCLGRTVGRKLG